MPRRIRGPALVLVLALMAGSAALALPARPAVPAVAEATRLFPPLWDWLSGLFAPGQGNALHATSAEEGSDMDPNGVVARRLGDAGSGLGGPNGMAAPPPSDAGSDMDPNG